MSKTPVLEKSPTLKEPVLREEPGVKCWTFSFRFWEQQKYFALDHSDTKWYVSFLERLQELSAMQIDEFISDDAVKNTWRYHHIDWGQKNVPIQRKDLTKLDEAYLNNPDDYPILQFQISRALGRVVGFWDEYNVFNILLLDPLHNIQPSKYYDYKVDKCNPLSSEYTSLLHNIRRIRRQHPCKGDCGVTDQLNDIETNVVYTNVIMHYISDEDKTQLDTVMRDTTTTCEEILMIGCEFLLE